MKIRIMSIIALAMLTVTITVTVHASTLYTVGCDSTYTNYEFGRVDTDTGQYQAIHSLGSTMYSNLVSQGNGSFYIYENGVGLRTIDTSGTISGGAATRVTGFTGTFTPYGMAYSSLDQKIYAYEYTTNFLGSIDPSNGAWNPGKDLGYSASYYGNFAGRLAIHKDVLYGAIGDITAVLDAGFFDTISYAGETINSVTNTDFFDMVLSSDGTNLYGITGSGRIGFVSDPPPPAPYTDLLYTINPNDGTLSSSAVTLYNMPYTLSGAAAVGTPEPSTYLLLMIALGAVGFARKKINN